MPNEPTALRLLALVVVFVAGAVCGNCGGSIARAEVEPSDAVLLARLCVSESGLRAYTLDDCAAIDAVLDFRREHVPAYRGLTYSAALHLYSRRATIDREGRPRPWLAELDEDLRRPDSWTTRARWPGRGRAWWRRTLDHARRVLAGEVRPSCSPHSWAREDVRPADPEARVIDCGDTLNVFWEVPRYRERWGSPPS